MSSELLIRLAALEKENAALRGKAAPPESSPESIPEPPRPKMEAVLGALREAAIELAKDNDPEIDATVQNAARTQALSKVVARLTACVASGLGATGTMIGQLNEKIESVAARPGGGVAQVAGEAQQTEMPEMSEMVEVDNTGAPGAPAAPAAPTKNGGGGKGKQRPVAAAPVGPPVGPPPAVPGMPAEVAQLQQVPMAPIMSVTVKP